MTFLILFFSNWLTCCVIAVHHCSLVQVVIPFASLMNFVDVIWWFLLKNDRNAFFPWLEASWHQPISKPIGFFDSPCTFEEGNSGAICIKLRQYFVEEKSLFFPCVAKDINIVSILQCYQIHIWLVWWLIDQNQRHILGPWVSTYIFCQKVWWSHRIFGILHQVQMRNIELRYLVL